MEWMAEYVFVRCVSVCLSVCAQRTGQSDKFKTVKATDLKFDTHVPRDSRDITPKNFSKRGRGQGHVTSNLWALSANSSKTVKATDFKFDVRVSRDSPDMTA